MKRLSLLLPLLMTTLSHAESTNAPLAADHLSWQSRRGGELQYLIHLPKEYSASKPAERWPLMLFLHGAGESGR